MAGYPVFIHEPFFTLHGRTQDRIGRFPIVDYSWGRNTFRRKNVRKFILVLALMILAASVTMSAAQTTPTATPAGSTTRTTTQATQTPSSVNIFYVACENQGVINFDGTMQPGYDIYYQLFSGPSGGGTALTALRQVSVNGSYAVSDQVAYN